MWEQTIIISTRFSTVYNKPTTYNCTPSWKKNILITFYNAAEVPQQQTVNEDNGQYNYYGKSGKFSRLIKKTEFNHTHISITYHMDKPDF